MTSKDIRIEIDDHEAIHAGACHVIAEAGANHNNSVDRAILMARKAADAGAWGIKFQLYKAETLTVPASPKYWTDTIGSETQYEAFKLSDHLPYEAWIEVAEACRELGIVFFATPFDLNAIEALEALDVAIYKLASADITHRRLIEAISRTGKPLFMSTGASTADEIERAIEWFGGGPEKLVVLVCTLTYPTPDEDANFARIDEFRRRFDPFLIGSSDHTLGPAGASMTAALGGVCIEKHFTLDPRAGEVPDHAMSVTPDELSEMVDAANRGAILRGSSSVDVAESEMPARELARRSVVSTVEILKGARITDSDIDFRRPGTGIPPYEADRVVGAIATQDIPANVTLTDEMIQ